MLTSTCSTFHMRKVEHVFKPRLRKQQTYPELDFPSSDDIILLSSRLAILCSVSGHVFFVIHLAWRRKHAHKSLKLKQK